MTVKDIKDPATRAHVEEMTAIMHQFAIKYGLSAEAVLELLRDRRYKKKAVI